MGLFKSKKQISEYSDDWGVAQESHEGRPLFIRYKGNLLDAVDRSEYQFQIGVAMSLLNPTEEGLPTNEEAEQLWSLEDSIDNALTANGEAVFVATLTTNGMRELIFYTKEWKPEYFEQKVKIVSNDSRYEPQFMMQPDKDWNTYREFAR